MDLLYSVSWFILAIWLPFVAYYFIPSDDGGYLR